MYNSSQVNENNNFRYMRRSSFTAFQSTGAAKFLQNNKYSQPGGDMLSIYVPNNFLNLIKTEKSAKSNRSNKKKKGDDAG